MSMPEQPSVAEDIDNTERRWLGAVNIYMEEGDVSRLVALLRDSSIPTVSQDARDLLADLVEGNAARTAGRPKKRYEQRRRSIAADVFEKWEQRRAIPKRGRGAGEPKMDAIDEVARCRGLTSGAVRGIVDSVMKGGINLSNWRLFLKEEVRSVA